MVLDQTFMEYPMRRYGMDHDRYEWSMLTTRKPVVWPDEKKLALWVNVSLQHFPMNPTSKLAKLPGSMTMPYPDLRHYTLRDYGNRVGIYRFLNAFDRYGIKPTFAINAHLAERYPALLGAVVERGDEIIGHSWSMDTPHVGGLAKADEAELVQRALDRLRALTGSDIRGWLSPGKLESEHTPDLLKAHGIEYFCDWVNDDMPYRFHTKHGDLWAMPLSTEIEDRFVIMENLHSEADWAIQAMDACDMLLAEAREQGGRILSLSIHPWVLGQPHRIRHLESVLEYVMSKSEVWSVGAGELLDSFINQP